MKIMSLTKNEESHYICKNIQEWQTVDRVKNLRTEQVQVKSRNYNQLLKIK